MLAFNLTFLSDVPIYFTYSLIKDIFYKKRRLYYYSKVLRCCFRFRFGVNVSHDIRCGPFHTKVRILAGRWRQLVTVIPSHDGDMSSLLSLCV